VDLLRADLLQKLVRLAGGLDQNLQAVTPTPNQHTLLQQIMHQQPDGTLINQQLHQVFYCLQVHKFFQLINDFLQAFQTQIMLTNLLVGMLETISLQVHHQLILDLLTVQLVLEMPTLHQLILRATQTHQLTIANRDMLTNQRTIQITGKTATTLTQVQATLEVTTLMGMDKHLDRGALVETHTSATIIMVVVVAMEGQVGRHS
jgi:tRNA/tmRNA/rRNA uracil-C5-methylase (TrmA/RlmC/RlmD family)